MKGQKDHIRRVAEKHVKLPINRCQAHDGNQSVYSTRVFRGQEERVQQACVLANGKGAVTACGDHSVQVYSLSGDDPIHTFGIYARRLCYRCERVGRGYKGQC